MRFRRKRVLGLGALLVGLQVYVSLVLMQTPVMKANEL